MTNITAFRKAKAIAAAALCAALLTGCSAAPEKGYFSSIAQSLDGGMNGIAYDMADSVTGGTDFSMNQGEDFNTEEYSAITENSYKSTVSDPLSTFSIDVDTASYTNLRRMINSGWEIPEDAVRIEEMINYFHYDYPAPNAGEPFSVTTELSDCPWNSDTKLMLVGLQAEEVDLSERAPMNLVFLIDVSGSMYSSDKLPLVQKAFTLLTENLTPADRISIVTYAGSDNVLLEGADGGDQKAVLDAIDSLEAGGSTAGAAGINTAYEIAEKYFISGGNNRIIL
ncbi:MAG: von Willebrand factor type A domain-containing protein, partial [Oscillospiraceae bacterium]